LDASAAWAFPNKWQRIAVGAGGIDVRAHRRLHRRVRLGLGHRAGHGHSITARLAFNIMLSSSLATVLFNANPLMRFDGYYILGRPARNPNLAQRSNKQLLQLVQKHILPHQEPHAPNHRPRREAILIVYGLLAAAYRIFLFISITLFIMASSSPSAWCSRSGRPRRVHLPVGKMVHWLATGSQISEHRLPRRDDYPRPRRRGLHHLRRHPHARPPPRHRRGRERHQGLAPLRRRRLHRPGPQAPRRAHRRGEPIVTLESRELEQRKRSMLSQLDEFAISERDAINRGEPPPPSSPSSASASPVENIAELDRRTGELVVRAPHDGRRGRNDPALRLGGFVKRGRARVRRCRSLRHPHRRHARPATGRVALRTPPARPTRPSSARSPRLDVSQILEADHYDVVPAGQRTLPSAALGFTGGGSFETENKDESGRVTKAPAVQRPHLGQPADVMAAARPPGERVKVRFKLPPRPLLAQWLDRLQARDPGPGAPVKWQMANRQMAKQPPRIASLSLSDLLFGNLRFAI